MSMSSNLSIMTVQRFAKIALIVVVCCIQVHLKRIPTFAGPYRLLIVRMGNISEEYDSPRLFWTSLHTTQARGKQPQYGWGYSHIPQMFTDIYTLEVNMASRSNNQWKRNAVVIKLDRGCTNAVFHGADMLRLLYGSDHNLTCPIKPIGLKEVKNQTIDLRFPHFPVLPYARYLFTMLLMRGGEIFGGSEAEIEIVPRL